MVTQVGLGSYAEIEASHWDVGVPQGHGQNWRQRGNISRDDRVLSDFPDPLLLDFITTNNENEHRQ